MIIQEEDFRLTSISAESPFFDLELLYKVQPKGKEARMEFKSAGYGMSLESAIKRVVQYRISNKHETLSLKEYLEEYRTEAKKLQELCGV